ncbi:MAG: PQQ-binding-like beta-propeller repeat protein, partial [Phycisphaerales bacterium]
MAIDLKTKKILWRHSEQEPVDGRAVCMRNSRIYYLSPEKLLACLNVETGRVVWKTSNAALLKAIGPLFPRQPRWTGLSPFPYVKCNNKFLFFSGPRIPRVVAVSTEDGTLQWQKEVPLTDAGSVHLLLREDALYAVGQGTGITSFSMEYDTGEVLTHFLGRRACTMVTGSTDSIFYRAPGGTVRIDPVKGAVEHIAPMRPPCYEGVIVSGGLLHWGPWKCCCQLSLYGHICLSPAGDFNYRPGLDESRLESGLGDPTRVEKFEVHPDDWPRYNASNGRASTTKVAIPRQVSQQWTSRPSSSAIPTAPVVAGGVVFVGDHNGLLRALDASDGKLSQQTSSGISLQGSLYIDEGQLRFAGGNAYQLASYDLETGECTSRPNDRFSSTFRTAFYPYYPERGQYVSLNHTFANGKTLNCTVDYSGLRHRTPALFEPLPPSAKELPPNWPFLPRTQGPKTKPSIVWQSGPHAKYNSFVVAPGTLLTGSQTYTGGRTASFLAAVSIEDGSQLWR